MRDHLRLMQLRLAIVAAALVVAPAAQAFTMNTMTDPGGGARVVDPAVPLEDAAKGKTTTQQGGLQFSISPSEGIRPGSFGSSQGFSSSGNRNLWTPPDQSRFNDR